MAVTLHSSSRIPSSTRITSHFKSHSYLGLKEVFPVVRYVPMADIKNAMHKGNKSSDRPEFQVPKKFGLDKQKCRSRRGDLGAGGGVCVSIWLLG